MSKLYLKIIQNTYWHFYEELFCSTMAHDKKKENTENLIPEHFFLLRKAQAL